MTLNGGVTYEGVKYNRFNNERVNLGGTETPLPPNCYLSPMMWVADNPDNAFNTATDPPSGVWTTAQWDAALPALLSIANTTLTRSSRADLGRLRRQHPLRCAELQLHAGKRLRWQGKPDTGGHRPAGL